MPRPKTRASLLQKETIWEIKNLFGNARNGYRNLKPFEKNVGWYAFARAMRGDECPQPQIEIIENLWADYKDAHNYDTELTFEPITDDQFPTVKRTRTRTGGAPGAFMDEEEDDEIVHDFVEFDD